MTTKDNGGFAYPQTPTVGPAGDLYHACEQGWGGGMSLRDWFAGQYLAGMGTWTPGEPPSNITYGIAEWHAWCVAQRAAYAYQQADAMISERSK